MKNDSLTIIAGPCSIDTQNINEVYDIASLEIKNKQGKKQRAIAGTRIVGLKSRTELNITGKGMGIDYETYIQNRDIMAKGGTLDDLKKPPSVEIAQKVYKKTNFSIATEVMNPFLQIPHYNGLFPKNKVILWNPSVNQLGWPIMDTARYAAQNGWQIGIKNGKWLDVDVHYADQEGYEGTTTLEKTWAGLATYAQGEKADTILIHRGVDIPDKGDYRNRPVHAIAQRVKKKSRAPLYFDPSHAYGPKMRQHIVPAVIDAMQMKMNEEEYLYDGLLIEVGTSQTDTDQHISLDELAYLVKELSLSRLLVSPESII